MFNNPCGPGYDGGTYMWMGDAATVPRTLSTAPMDLSCGGQVCFYFKMAVQAQASPCEGPDQADEGVYFDYWDGINNYYPLNSCIGTLFINDHDMLDIKNSTVFRVDSLPFIDL